MTPTVVASRGPTTFMVKVSEDMVRVLDIEAGLYHPEQALQAVLARGYWEDCDADLGPLLAYVEDPDPDEDDDGDTLADDATEPLPNDDPDDEDDDDPPDRLEMARDEAAIHEKAWDTRGRSDGTTTRGTAGGSGDAVSSSARASAGHTRPAPSADVQAVADQYTAAVGITPAVVPEYAEVDQNISAEIADAYDALPDDDSDNPAVIEAYTALATEVEAQWQHALNAGMTFVPWTEEGQPYATSLEMAKDVRDNKRLFFYRGGEPNKFMSKADASGLTVNDKFRAIHDYYAHAAGGYGFGPRGEENAWLKHSQMFTRPARRAMTTETRGQNSWVNFGRQNYNDDGSPKNIPAQDRPYAKQKIALMPDKYVFVHQGKNLTYREKLSLLLERDEAAIHEKAWDTRGRKGDDAAPSSAEPGHDPEEARIGANAIDELQSQVYKYADDPRDDEGRLLEDAGILKDYIAQRVSKALAAFDADALRLASTELRLTGPNNNPRYAGKPAQALVDATVHQWAETSGDHSPASITMQMLAKEEFDLKDAKTHADWPDAVARHNVTLTSSTKAIGQAVLRAMHTKTQSDLAELKLQGVTHLTLYRGTKMSEDKHGGHTTHDLQTQPMSSFSTNYEQARLFGIQHGGDGVIIAVRVPIERVLSTTVSGYGCKKEDEVVVLGGKYRARVSARGSIPLTPKGFASHVNKSKETPSVWKPVPAVLDVAYSMTNDPPVFDIDEDLVNADWPKIEGDPGSGVPPGLITERAPKLSEYGEKLTRFLHDEPSLFFLVRDQRAAAYKAWETRRANGERRAEPAARAARASAPSGTGKAAKPRGHNVTRATGNINQDVADRMLSGKSGIEVGKAMLEDVDEAGLSFTFEVYADPYGRDRVSWKMKGSDGSDIERSIYMNRRGEKEVHHDFFRIGDRDAPDATKLHYAKDAMRGMMRQYEEHGVKVITVNAALTQGGYAWARYGFLPDSPRDVADQAKSQVRRLSGLTPEQKTTIIDGIDKMGRSKKVLWYISDLRGEGGRKLGHEILAGTSWTGKLTLTNKAQMAKFRKYVGKGPSGDRTAAPAAPRPPSAAVIATREREAARRAAYGTPATTKTKTSDAPRR